MTELNGHNFNEVDFYELPIGSLFWERGDIWIIWLKVDAAYFVEACSRKVSEPHRAPFYWKVIPTDKKDYKEYLRFMKREGEIVRGGL